jgi:flagellar biogenesis protein FliO
MSPQRKWLLLPPAVALLLVLGPLSMQQDQDQAETDPAAGQIEAAKAAAELIRRNPGQQATPAVTQAATAATPAAADATKRPALPRTPDLWQVGSTLAGVLVLGVSALLLFRRLRNGTPSRAGNAIALRHSLRLSARQAVHAVEFEGRLLLLGESERGITMLHAATETQADRDEATIAARSATVDAVIDDEDEGAVPRNLVIPRADHARTQSPSTPRSAAERKATGTSPSQSSADTVLNDFRTLLAKAGR